MSAALFRRVAAAGRRAAVSIRLSHGHAAAAHPPAAAEPSILCAKRGALEVVTLNRPKQLNSLNLEMVRSLTKEVRRIDADAGTAAVLLRGAGDRAFCAGGDVKKVWEGRGTAEGAAAQDAFFREEYILDYLLARSSQRKPHVALYHGHVMGGGVGVSINAAFRVATEKAVFAMPETGIGLIPDVGGSFFLPRLPAGFGYYLGLSGQRLEGPDLVHAGVATHFMHSSKIAAVEEELASLPPPPPAASAAGAAEAQAARVGHQIDAILRKHAAPLPPFSFPEAAAKALGAACSKGTMEEVGAALMALTSDPATVLHAKRAIDAIEGMCPLSLKVTLEQLRRGGKLTLAECYQMELRLVLRCMERPDFYEGVRALLIDRKPETRKWAHARLGDIKQAEVDAFFAPLPHGKELVLPEH